MKSFYVYVMVTCRGELRSNITNDLDEKRRQAERKDGQVAIDGNPWGRIIYYEEHQEFGSATRFLNRCRAWIRFRQQDPGTYADLVVDFLRCCVLNAVRPLDREIVRP